MISRTLKFRNTIIRITETTNYPIPDLKYKEMQEIIARAKLEMSKHKRESPEWRMYRQDIQDTRFSFHKQDFTKFGRKKKVSVSKKERSPRVRFFQMKITVNNWTKHSYTQSFELLDNDDMNRTFRSYIRDYRRFTVKQSRKNLKLFETMDRFSLVIVPFFGTRKSKGGRVFAKAGQVLVAYVKKNLGKLYEDKKPLTKTNYIGVEIEFCAAISEEDLAIRMFRGGFHRFVQLKHDGSLRPHKEEGEFGFEFAMLLKESSYRKDLKLVTDFLKTVKAIATDRRCGLHVHFDMRRREKELVYNNLVACQNALWAIVDPRRYDAEFCRNVKTKSFPTHFTGDREERYKTINAASYFRHKTLEVRMHEGCVDFGSICNWIDVLLKIVNYKKTMKTDINQLPALKTKMKIAPKVYKAVLDKSCHWQVNFPNDARQINREQRRPDRLFGADPGAAWGGGNIAVPAFTVDAPQEQAPQPEQVEEENPPQRPRRRNPFDAFFDTRTVRTTAPQTREETIRDEDRGTPEAEVHFQLAQDTLDAMTAQRRATVAALEQPDAVVTEVNQAERTITITTNPLENQIVEEMAAVDEQIALDNDIEDDIF